MPLIMGILNATPDSFYDGVQPFSLEAIVRKAEKLIQEGSDIIDIGGESSRPGAKPVSVEEELQRVLPVIEHIRKNHSISISIDTRNPLVAKKSLEKGANLINDITGFRNLEMQAVAKEFGVDVCLMHMNGTPDSMQKNPHYPEGVIPHIRFFFERRIEELLQAGIKEEKIILDPGIGFGKTVTHNLEILQHMDVWKSFGLRVLIGLSRKSFMAKILGKDANSLLPATLAMNTIALFMGSDIIRVHDVAEHKDIVHMLARFNNPSQ